MNVSKIKDPYFLERLNNKDLINLSNDIREFLIENISKTGGHLSSNLGIVELTIALHKNFDFGKDKLIFDVGHQAYTHKILTGRAKRFSTLRQTKGLSGFQSRKESRFDCYEAGHSSTSLSAALGFACARKRNDDYYVVAVIGDGSMGNGLSYEALNNIGSYNAPLIIILNDNEMSINENVGALHNTLDKLRSKKSYINTKDSTKGVLNKVPFVGKRLVSGIHHFKSGIRAIYNKNSFFDEMGIKYYGPINGHDFKELNLYLNIAKNAKKPVILHVITEKGKGYKFASEDKEGKWHGVPPFDIETGEFNDSTDKYAWCEIISNELIKLRRKNDRICVITPAMASGAKLNSFKEVFPKSFYDTGITESHALVFACAMGLQKKIPFVSIYSTFLQRGYDQVIHDIARCNSHVIVGIDRAGIVGSDGVSHQGIYDISFLMPIPNIILCQPKDCTEAQNLLFTAVKTNKPFFIRYSKNKIKYKEGKKNKLIEIGSWECNHLGKNGTIISYGDFFKNAIQIGKQLDLNVINARFLKPIDTVMWNKIIKQKKPIFIYEESTKIGSLGSYLKSINSDVDITIIAIDDKFIPHGKNEDLYKELGLDMKSVSELIKSKIKSSD